MTDPFESLRHDAEGTGSTAIDPQFRAELLAEARQRLMSDASTDSSRPRVPTDTPTPIPMEPIPMLAKNLSNTRPLLLAAACVALVSAGVVTVVALTGGYDQPPATTDTTPATATPTVAPTEPITTSVTPSSPSATTESPATTTTDETSATTTPEQRVTDENTALASLVTAADLGEGFAQFRDGTDYAHFQFDSVVSTSSPCQPYLGTVFVPMAGAVTNNRLFVPPEPNMELVRQRVAVLDSDATAQAIWEAMASSAFQPCALASGRMFDGLRFSAPETPPSVPDGARVALYHFTKQTAGAGDRAYIGALIQVGRTITYVDAMQVNWLGEAGVSDEQFDRINDRVIATTAAAVAE